MVISGKGDGDVTLVAVSIFALRLTPWEDQVLGILPKGIYFANSVLASSAAAEDLNNAVNFGFVTGEGADQ